MPREKVVKLRRIAPERNVAPSSALEQGTHFGRLEAREPKDRFRFRASGGEVLRVHLADGFEPAFAEECIAEGRLVLSSVAADGEGVAIGALQTSSASKSDVVKLSGRRVEIDAREHIAIRVGKSTFHLDREGTLKLSGKNMTMDVATLVRIASALVELP